MTHEQQIIASMAITRMDAAKRALGEGETTTAKHHLHSAIQKIGMIETISPAAPAPEQKRTGAFLEIEANSQPQ